VYGHFLSDFESDKYLRKSGYELPPKSIPYEQQAFYSLTKRH